MYVGSVKKDGFQGEPLTSSSTQFEPFSDWVKTNMQCCAHTNAHTHAVHTDIFSTTDKQMHFWGWNLWHLRLARVQVKMLTHYTNPPLWKLTLPL